MKKEATKVIFSNLAVYGLSHALVDAACGAVLFGLLQIHYIDLKGFIWLLILYNLLAFGGQSIFGLIIDKIKAPRFSAIIGCLITATSTIFVGISPIVAVSLAGIGNALFHVGGGSITLNLTPKKASAPGFFVAPGALGLFIGTLIGKKGYFTSWYFIILLSFCILLMLVVKLPKLNYDRKALTKINSFELILLLILLAIAIRSFVGLAIVFPWKSNLTLVIILTCAVVLGKGLGGILADKFGWIKVAVGALLISCPLLALGSSVPWVGILGMFLFNMTMPVTLVAISNILPGRPGFAFGLTCLALFIGALPVFTKIKDYLNSPLAIAVITFISVITLYFGLKFYFKKDRFLN